MRRILIQNCEPGVVLGQPIFGDRGELLLAKGVPITAGQIETLVGLGCTSVVVDDEESEGIYLPELVSAIVRFKTATKLSNTISRFRQLTVGVVQDDPLLAAAALEKALKSGQFRRQIRDVDPFANLLLEVQELVQEIMYAETLDGLDPLIVHHDYALGQSVDSAIVAAMIGKTVGLPLERVSAHSRGFAPRRGDGLRPGKHHHQPGTIDGVGACAGATASGPGLAAAAGGQRRRSQSAGPSCLLPTS